MATTQEIFAANQVLTLEIAKTLIGKKIATTNAEYKYNTPSVREFVLGSIESEWDLAAKREYPKVKDATKSVQYNNFQEYYADALEHRIDEFKSRLKLVANGTDTYATCDTSDTWTFNEPTFFGSDSDREIYYIIIEG